MPPLTFDEEAHEYRLDGVVIPSVTQVIREAGLIDTQWYTEEGRERGAEVALVTELHDKGILDEDTVTDEIRPYLKAWKRFKADTGFLCELIEEPVYHRELRYAGTLDRIGTWRESPNRILLDIKTGGPEPCHAIQTAAYAACFTWRAGPLRFGIHLDNSGKYRIAAHTDPNDRRVFNAALAIANWKHNHKVTA